MPIFVIVNTAVTSTLALSLSFSPPLCEKTQKDYRWNHYVDEKYILLQKEKTSEYE